MKKVILSMTLLSLIGCGGATRWANPGASIQQSQRDFTECQYDVVKNTPTYDGIGDPIAAGLAIGERKNSIMSACMGSKGYILEAIKQ